jgi:hypothetical protein
MPRGLSENLPRQTDLEFCFAQGPADFEHGFHSGRERRFLCSRGMLQNVSMSLAEERSAPGTASVESPSWRRARESHCDPVAMRLLHDEESVMPVSGMPSGCVMRLRSSSHNPFRRGSEDVARGVPRPGSNIRLRNRGRAGRCSRKGTGTNRPRCSRRKDWLRPSAFRLLGKRGSPELWVERSSSVMALAATLQAS